MVDRGPLKDSASFGFGGGATAASTLLSTIAGSVITVAGLAFSLTIVTLQLVSSQFTPRAVGTFLKDRFNQITLGCFAGVFAYCVVVLRSIRSAEEPGGGFVPGVSVNLGILLGLGSVQLLVVFIFRVGRSIEVGDIATRLGADTEQEIARRYAEASTAPSPAGETLVAAWRQSGQGQLVHAAQSGYVQEVRERGLIAALANHSGRAKLAVCAGDFVTPRTVLAELWADEPLPERTLTRVAGCVVITSQRSLAHDPEFGLRQLTDIALRAISPGVNDPTTAVMCIGFLRGLLEEIAARADQPEVRGAGPVTLVLRRRSFSELLHASVIEIGRYSATDARVADAVLELLQGVGAAATTAGAPGRLPHIEDCIEAVAGPALAEARTDLDRELLTRRVQAARDAVRTGSELAAPTAR